MQEDNKQTKSRISAGKNDLETLDFSLTINTASKANQNTDLPEAELPSVPAVDAPPEEDGEDSDNGEAPGITPDQMEQIKEIGSITPAKGKHLIHCLTVVGQVEGHYILPAQNKTTKYEHVIPQLVAIEEDPNIEGLVIILNTVGGDVEAGLAIAELIAGMRKPTVSLVLGGGHSIGVPLAVSARRSFIAPSATMTVHPVRMSGLVLGVPQTLSYFEKMQDRITRFVSDNSGVSAERFMELMMNTGELVTDVGSVLDGDAAVREGLIDGLGGLSDVIDCLYEMIESGDPPTKRKMGKAVENQPDSPKKPADKTNKNDKKPNQNNAGKKGNKR